MFFAYYGFAQTEAKEKALTLLTNEKEKALSALKNCKNQLPQAEETYNQAKSIVTKCRQANDNAALAVAENALRIAEYSRQKLLDCIKSNREYADRLILITNKASLDAGIAVSYYMKGDVKIKRNGKWEKLDINSSVKKKGDDSEPTMKPEQVCELLKKVLKTMEEILPSAETKVGLYSQLNHVIGYNFLYDNSNNNSSSI